MRGTALQGECQLGQQRQFTDMYDLCGQRLPTGIRRAGLRSGTSVDLLSKDG